MIRKEYKVAAISPENDAKGATHNSSKDDIIKIINTSLLKGAIVELKIVEGVDLNNEGKRFSKIRLDIISNTDYDKYEV
ncbi:MAG: hypothetical protein K9G49_07155 [Taibaiella sp.]|nr:hypothetical protein [Taibaiella sp.]